MSEVLFPGSFDPLTNAHLEIIERLVKLNMHVTIGIFENDSKNGFLAPEEKKEMIESIIKNRGWTTVDVMVDSGLLVDICIDKHINIVARGIRSIKDYEYEKEMEYNNKKILPTLEYIYLTSGSENNYTSSTIVRELIKHNRSFEHLVPNEVKNYIEEKNG